MKPASLSLLCSLAVCFLSAVLAQTHAPPGTAAPSLCPPQQELSALQWIQSQQSSTSGLVLSFLSDEAWTTSRGYAYDNAVAAISLLLHTKHSSSPFLLSAEGILEGLAGGLHDSDEGEGLKAVPFYFDIVTGVGAGYYRSGTAAWVAESFALHWLITGKSTFSSPLKGVCDWLLVRLAESGDKDCVVGGPDVTWCSGEHNIDSYFVLHLAGYLMTNSTYSDAAAKIAQTLYGPNFWNTYRFNQGYGDAYRALDVQSWGSVWLLGNAYNSSIDMTERRQRVELALSFADSSFLSEQDSVLGGSATGYGPYADSSNGYHSEVVWSEGSLGVGLAYRRLGNDTRAGIIIDDLRAMLGADGSLLYAANETVVDVSGEHFKPIPSLAGTAWLALTCSARNEVFWNADVDMYNTVVEIELRQ